MTQKELSDIVEAFERRMEAVTLPACYEFIPALTLLIKVKNSPADMALRYVCAKHALKLLNANSTGTQSA